MKRSLALLLPLAPAALAQSDAPPQRLLEPLPAGAQWGTEDTRGELVAFLTGEESTDYNQDGDMADTILALYDRASHALTVTDLDARGLSMGDGFVAATRFEQDSGIDFNGDGDLADSGVVVYDLASGTHTMLPASVTRLRTAAGGLVAVSGLDKHSDPYPLLLFRPSTGTLLPVAGDVGKEEGEAFVLDGTGLVFCQRESYIVGDLNGDGDHNDQLLSWISADLTTRIDSGELVQRILHVTPDWIVFSTWEDRLDRDANLDGDQMDTVLSIADRSTGAVRVIGVADDESKPRVIVADGRVLFEQDEEFAGDLNGDGDVDDEIVVAVPLAGGATLSSGIGGYPQAAAGGRALVYVFENVWGDKNGDGDTLDRVFHVWSLSGGTVTNLGHASASPGNSGIGPDLAVLLTEEGFPVVVDLATNQQEVLPIRAGGLGAPPSMDRGFVFFAGESTNGQDLNADGDLDDSIAFLYRARFRQLVNLRVHAREWNVGPRRFHLYSEEFHDGIDYTGDGDTLDATFLFGRW